MFWGGQAVRIVLGAVIGPKFVNMANTLPLSANVETVDLVCFFIFVIILGRVKTISMTFSWWLILS
jgi:nucleobase:cation symporter-1, NCS1 family